MYRNILVSLAFASLLITTAFADTINLTNGRSIQGTVLKETDDGVLIRSKYITATFKRSEIKSIEKSKNELATGSPALRLPGWEKFLDSAVGKKWVKELNPIPATVVDKGILKYVPYMSFRTGDYELNIYGDPDAPACLEIGIYKELLYRPEAKKNCLDLMVDVLLDSKDKTYLKTLSLTKDKKTLAGMTFEVTPETDEDAYGGWWISIYDEKALDKARASAKELEAITMKRDDVKKGQPALANPDSMYNYDPANLKYARPASTVPQPDNPAVVIVPAGDRVYVRGYYKANGTYVAPHTRSRPK
jgi:hypothetical protein